MAEEALLDLKVLLSGPIPPYPPVREVCSVLDRFSIEIRQPVDDRTESGSVNSASIYYITDYSVIFPPPLEIIALCWTLFCETGEVGVREFSPEAGLIRESTLRAFHAVCPLICPGPESSKLELVHFVMISQALDSRIPENCQIIALKILRYICIQNEENREILTSYIPVISALVRLIRRNQPSSGFMREWCAAVKALLLQDDIMVSYNRSSERKRVLFQENTLRHLSQYLNDYEDAETLNSIVVILGTMACHHDYCMSMDAGGVLPGLVKIFTQYSDKERLTVNALSLLRFVCMSADVRTKTTVYNLVSHVLRAVSTYQEKVDAVQVGFSCLAYLTLRCKCNAQQFINEGGVDVILGALPPLTSNSIVVKGACSTLRNVVVGVSSEYRRIILEHESFERTFREIEEKHSEIHKDYIKPLIRDLGSPVSPDVNSKTSISSSNSSNSASTLTSRASDPSGTKPPGDLYNFRGHRTRYSTGGVENDERTISQIIRESPEELPRISLWTSQAEDCAAPPRPYSISTIPLIFGGTKHLKKNEQERPSGAYKVKPTSGFRFSSISENDTNPDNDQGSNETETPEDDN